VTLQFGETLSHGFDADGYERREQASAVVECDRCGKGVLLVSDTEEWVEGEDGLWHHCGYGPAQGVCCHTLYVDGCDGCFAYDLKGGAP
jgi:hypothetical protein